MMQRLLYVDSLNTQGSDRFRRLEGALDSRDTTLHFAGYDCEAEALTDLDFDLLVADMRGLDARQRRLVIQMANANPDLLLVLVAEQFGREAADALLVHDAVDCVCLGPDCKSLVGCIRQTLGRLAISRRTIQSMTNRIEELDVTCTLGDFDHAAASLARYTHRHISQMDFCSLRGQFRAVRSLEELVDCTTKLLGSMDDDRGSGRVPIRVRIHLSTAGFRCTLQLDAAELRDQYGDVLQQVVNQVWLGHLFMDEVEIDRQRSTITMFMLPDDVCDEVHQAISRLRQSGLATTDLLTEALRKAQQ